MTAGAPAADGAIGRLSDCVSPDRGTRRRAGPALVGAIDGEGCGPELVQAALVVLGALTSAGVADVQVRRAPWNAARDGGALSAASADFCDGVFAARGAVLAGAVGGRFVYELRSRFDLFCKLVPLRPLPLLAEAGPLRAGHLAGVDVLLVRENVGGVYQGSWHEQPGACGDRRVVHTFSYSEAEVRRIVSAAACLARRRRGRMSVVVKEGGIPGMTGLWRETGAACAAQAGVAVEFVNVDLAAYRFVQEPARLDVVVAPNLFGDVLADVGAVLLGGRALSFSGNFSGTGAAVYQTNHGAAADLAGTDSANPVAQILALAMLLRESAGLPVAATLVEAAVQDVWRAGWRTPDAAAAGCRVIGTQEMAARIADAVARRASAGLPDAAGAAAR